MDERLEAVEQAVVEEEAVEGQLSFQSSAGEQSHRAGGTQGFEEFSGHPANRGLDGEVRERRRGVVRQVPESA